MPTILGLDIGGANLKAASSGGEARAWPFALWKQPERLAERLREVRRALPGHERLAVTMTGELCDCFPSKRAGVLAILDSVLRAAEGVPVAVWTTDGQLVAPAAVRAEPLQAAAANWLALARLAARQVSGPALLIDVGSTTTDLVYVEPDQPQPRGTTDRARLAHGELVYTGLRRTPVCAVLGMRVAAEFFATMLDVHLLLGLRPEESDDCDTADGRPATLAQAETRLARLLCADVEECSPDELQTLARKALTMQVRRLCRAVDQVLAERPAVRQVVLSGSGEALGRQVVARHGRLKQLPVVSLTEVLGPTLSEGAAAYAVALLAAEGASGGRDGPD